MIRKKKKTTMEQTISEIKDLIDENYPPAQQFEVRITSWTEASTIYEARVIAVDCDWKDCHYAEHDVYLTRPKEKPSLRFSSVEVSETGKTVDTALRKLKRCCEKYLSYGYDIEIWK